MTFSIIIHEENGGYWAESKDFPGMFAQGDSLIELFENLKESIRLYLDEQ